MEGKKILKTLELADGYTICKMDDDTLALIKIIDPEISSDEAEEFFGGPVNLPKPEKKEEKPEAKEKKPEKKEPEDDDDDELTWEALTEMKRKALVKLVDDKKLLVDPEDYEDDDDGLRKEIAEELEIEVPAKGKKKEDDDDDDDKKKDDDDDNYTWKDLVDMDFDELSELCKENKLDTDPDDFDEDADEDKLRRAIAKECGIEAPPKKK